MTKNIYDCLALFSEAENIDEYYCESCKKKSRAVKKL